MRIATYILMFLAIAVISNGQSSFVLEGTIGKSPIVIKIEQGGATYFYKSRRKDIDLQGRNYQNGDLVLSRQVFDSKKDKEVSAESLTLRHSNAGSKVFTGVWKGMKAKTLPISLKPVDSTRYRDVNMYGLKFDNEADRLYNKVRFSGLVFINDSVVNYKGKYQLQWKHELLTGVSSFTVIKGYEPTIASKINKSLDAVFFSNLFETFNCSEWSIEGDFDTHIEGYFLSPDYVSVQSYGTWFCGRAHPSYNALSFTIDARTGRQIKDIGELFWFNGEAPVPENDKYYAAYIDARAIGIIEMLTKFFPKEMTKPANEDDCDYTAVYAWQEPTWYFTESGLYIGPGFPHAWHACNNPEFPVIPYPVLDKYKAKK